MAFDTQPSIRLFGLLIEEPVTALTDLFVTLVCIYSFIQLNSLRLKNKMHLYLKIYFFSLGIATTIGGLIGHGFFYVFNYNRYWKLPCWFTSMVSIAMLEQATIEYARKYIRESIGHFIAWFNVIELITFMILTFSTLNFFFVEVHSAYGLLVIVSAFNTFVFIKTRSRISLFYLIAVGFSALSALIFLNDWGMNRWFNHIDISHIGITLSAWFFYRGSVIAVKES